MGRERGVKGPEGEMRESTRRMTRASRGANAFLIWHIRHTGPARWRNFEQVVLIVGRCGVHIVGWLTTSLTGARWPTGIRSVSGSRPPFPSQPMLHSASHTSNRTQLTSSSQSFHLGLACCNHGHGRRLGPFAQLSLPQRQPGAQGCRTHHLPTQPRTLHICLHLHNPPICVVP